MLLAQISDLHVLAPGSGAKYGVDSTKMLMAAVDRLNALTPRPDAVLVTGDMSDLGTLDELGRVKAELDRLVMPSYVIAGNHDERIEIREVFADHTYLGSGEFLQWTVDAHDIRLVGLDTTILGQHDGELCEKRLAWLDAALAAVPDKPTVVAMHHPPFDTGIWWMDKGGLQRGGDELRNLLADHSQVVRVVCGHHHRSVFTAWGSTTVSVCPSTWFQIHLDLDPEARPRGVAEPPSLQLHRWDGSMLVTNTMVIDPGENVDFLNEWGGDWGEMRERLRTGAATRKS